jgi:hypothetical protein
MALRLALTGAVVSVAIALSCDPIVYARASAPLVVPVDSACLNRTLASRLGAPSLKPVFEKQTRYFPAALTVYYDRASFTQTYPDSGEATLTAAEAIAGGIGVFSYSHAKRDSISRQLGNVVLAARDACGGRAVPGRPEITYPR